MITIDKLRQIMPFAGKRAMIFLEPLNNAMDEFEINTLPRVRMFLANIGHESGSLHYTAEIASGSAYDNRTDLGNTEPDATLIAQAHGSTPGRWWKGRGLIQITGYDNYRALSDDLYSDPNLLLHHPELLEQPRDAARSAGWFWKRNALWKWADAGDFDGVCDMINRGHKTKMVGDANGYSERLDFYRRACKVLP